MSGLTKLTLASAVVLFAAVQFTIAQRPSPGPSPKAKPVVGPTSTPPTTNPPATTPSSPRSDMPQLELPPSVAIPTPPQGESQAIEKRIQQVLSGQSDGETGDPVLDDILSVLNQRGSILKGSVLDTPETQPKKNKEKGNRYRAAEFLLRASRVLEGLGDLNPSQTDLIKKMRSESAQLLNSTQ